MTYRMIWRENNLETAQSVKTDVFISLKSEDMDYSNIGRPGEL